MIIAYWKIDESSTYNKLNVYFNPNKEILFPKLILSLDEIRNLNRNIPISTSNKNILLTENEKEVIITFINKYSNLKNFVSFNLKFNFTEETLQDKIPKIRFSETNPPVVDPDPVDPINPNDFIILPRWKDFNNVPFVDATAYPTPKIFEWSTKTNIDGVFLGFIVSDVNKRPCFGGYPEIYDSNTLTVYSGDARVSNYLKEDIQKLRSNNKEIILSFGGASGQPLEEVITSEAVLLEMYKDIIENYNLRYLDFDFEGAFLAKKECLIRHSLVMKKLVSRYPNLKISYTLPVDGSKFLMGLNHNGEELLQILYENKIIPSMINVMAMEFSEMLQPEFYQAIIDSIEGKESIYEGMLKINPWLKDENYSFIKSLFNILDYNRGLVRQIKDIYTELSEDYIYKMIGICPMYGVNNNGKKYTLEDQKEIRLYKNKKNIPLLSGWSLNRDFTGTGLPNFKPGEFNS